MSPFRHALAFGFIGSGQRPWMSTTLLKRRPRFEEGFLKISTDRHDLPGRFHGGPKRPVRRSEFVKGPTRYFHDAVIERWLKRCRRAFTGDGVRQLIQGVTNRNFSRHSGDWIAGRF